ncbi:ATP-binding protein [Calothrix sp. 336/3]|uniref:ATP-binding protein n=1 Tax=Calothrix sp. 336/3 TaxID=1337936 RepID=UPI0004E42A85|nr:cyanophycin synthetase [Calothrix sp. 336/3]AKG20836.1 cyanophycin synthetase [Calothrix sp. 336/3]
MLKNINQESLRVNARKTDAFDIFNFKYYIGANPYLNTAAVVFNFALTEYWQPLEIEDYVAIISDRYPQIANKSYDSYADIFAQTVCEVGKLAMDLHYCDRRQAAPSEHRHSIKPYPTYNKIAVQTLHTTTTRAVIYCVWDWFEAMNQDEQINIGEQIQILQNKFRQSVYGGPTNYALLRAANHKNIPTSYLWEEGVTQYGYGKKQVRGTATTFDCDSHLDSDFTTRKDDCKEFLKTLGFPVPEGEIVTSLRKAFTVATNIGYPVAIKPVVGHKGIGVTADIQDSYELENAFDRAVDAIPTKAPIHVIVEKSFPGKDFRLLCVNGKFVAACERHPASVIGDGYLTIDELIDQENRQAARADTPTSPMSKIKRDDAMEIYLEQQGLSLDSVVAKDKKIYLRKVANLSAGGVSINATDIIHPDNIILAQDIAQHFRLTCLGIDVITENLSESWKNGKLAILEINAAPGILMHLNPAIGESIDVPSQILETFFTSSYDARIPIITCNHLSVDELQKIIDYLLSKNPAMTIGGVCQGGIVINQFQKNLHPDYNTNVQTLLRHPRLDLLIAEYTGDILEKDGMFYCGSNLVILQEPTEIEMILKRDIFEDSTVIIKQGDNISIQSRDSIQESSVTEEEPFIQICCQEIEKILPEY